MADHPIRPPLTGCQQEDFIWRTSQLTAHRLLCASQVPEAVRSLILHMIQLKPGVFSAAISLLPVAPIREGLTQNLHARTHIAMFFQTVHLTCSPPKKAYRKGSGQGCSIVCKLLDSLDAGSCPCRQQA